MKAFKLVCIMALVVTAIAVFSSFFAGPRLVVKKYKFPYKSQGLTERQAAAHLLSRFTFGATPGQVDSVVKMGLENWFAKQLSADLPDDSLNKKLSVYDDLNYTNAEVANVFPIRQNLYNMAARDGYVSKDSLYVAVNKRAFNASILAYMKDKGYKSEQDLNSQFFDQKILRAAYSNNQLREVLTDFWFNHFNVSYAKNGPGRFIPAYERDVIRPNVFGKFDELLIATAKSPAMLLYLDNVNSVGPAVVNAPKKAIAPTSVTDMNQGMVMGITTDTPKMMPVRPVRRNVAGLNENYAREVMELHTLGVDGGYTQSDVTQAARLLTGWTVFPEGDNANNNGLKKQYDRLGEEGMAKQGYVHDVDFVFNPTRHDKGEKLVLGHSFGANGGYDEGVELLEMLAHHPSAAKFITRKLAVRFVGDNPSPKLLDKMAKSFTEHDGEIKQVLITIVTSPEFWSTQALREKTKSPFELAISTIRSLNADITQPKQIYNWVAKMGQKIYYYLAPTGFPDKGAYWINTGSLLNRMNFGLELASHRIPGLKFNLLALNNNHEPESPEAALAIYGKLLIPERNLDQTIKQLTPLLNDPALLTKINTAANNAPAAIYISPPANSADMMDGTNTEKPKPVYIAQVKKPAYNTMLSQVVGIIIGSPEYQRR